jgi:exopolyphosphatase/guanosine-5'-triphosphate,3'-diphosphate pyrophosphatase
MTTTLRDGDELAAVDLGSNSFHLVVARVEHGQLRVIDRLREPIRLAAGLNEEGGLTPAKRREALACLAVFGQRLAHLPDERVWVVGTQALRRLKSPRAFLIAAETALGHPVEIVSGREEARLIYLGVAHGLKDSGNRRLVIDIGGGSTEFIIGEGFEAIERESLQMGCVVGAELWFADGAISRRRYQVAQTSIALQMQQFAADFRARGWQEAYGSSGTIRTIGSIARALGNREGVITRASVAEIRERILGVSHSDRLDLPGLQEDRRPIIAAGFVVFDTAMDILGIKSLQVAETAMREGLLYDMLGRAAESDPRVVTVENLAQRYAVDVAQASRVERMALHLFDQVAGDWELDDEHRAWLQFAARVHEIGLAIAHSQHHQHAEYLLENSDLAGFTRSDQEVLAIIVRGHRRNPPTGKLRALPPRTAVPARRVTVLLRLAALLHRARVDERPPKLTASARGDALSITLPQRWLDAHPLTRTDLEQEQEYLKDLGMRLNVGAA